MEAMAARCTLVAPFGGRIVDVPTRQHQFIGEGQPVLEMVDDGELEVEMIVPSSWLSWMRAGHRFEVEIEETGKRYGTQVTRLSGRVDAVSRSVKVYGKLLARAAELMPGMSGRALVDPPGEARTGVPGGSAVGG
jgi:multidrug efflux pump subunit AcrA (membrane-fusion protein)